MAAVQHDVDVEGPVPSAPPFGEAARNREIYSSEPCPVRPGEVRSLRISGASSKRACLVQ